MSSPPRARNKWSEEEDAILTEEAQTQRIAIQQRKSLYENAD